MLKRIFPMIAAGAMLAVFCFAEEPATQPAGEQTVTPSGLTIIEQGFDNMTVQKGDRVTCHYTLTLENGTMVDSSLPRNEPFTFRLGVDKLIAGWAEGVLGMKVGQKRHLIVPPNLGYGAVGAPPAIPGNSTLHFDIEILYISRDGPQAPQAGKP